MQQPSQQSIDNRATMRADKPSADELIERVAQRAADIIEQRQHEVALADREAAMKLREGILALLRAWETLYDLPRTPTSRERKQDA